VARSIELVESALGQDGQRTLSIEEGKAVLAAEPRRTQYIEQMASVGLGPFKAMSRDQAQELVDSMILTVYGAAKFGAQQQIPVITRKVRRAVGGFGIGFGLISIAGSLLVWQQVRSA